MSLSRIPPPGPIGKLQAASKISRRWVVVNNYWREVNPSHKCPTCRHDHWCSVSVDGRFVACRRPIDDKGEHRVDRNGVDYWLYRLKDDPGAPPPELPDPAGPERADPDTLSKVYHVLLAMLRLNSQHRENFLRRGLPDTEINRRLYRTLPAGGRSPLAHKLVDLFSPEVCARVPGLLVKEFQGRTWWWVAGPPGIVIPCRDLRGRIVALKVRRDRAEGGGKYVYISSARRGGPGPGAPVHVPLWEGPIGDTVRLTEGELKADAATCLSGILTVSIPGVGCWRPAIPLLKELGAERVLVAFDADWKTTEHVRQALRRVAEALVKEGLEVLIELWPAEQGKGIDDLLAAGGEPEVVPWGRLALQFDDTPLKTLKIAVLSLAERCDGAVRKDGTGFNKRDAEFGHALAARIERGEEISPDLAREALKVLKKYARQLLSIGIDIGAIQHEIDRLKTEEPVKAVASEDRGERETQAQKLVKLALEVGIKLFHTPEGRSYATVPVGDHKETWPVTARGSGPFRNWLRQLFYAEHGKPPGSQVLQDAVGLLEAKAEFEGPEIPVFIRLAEKIGQFTLTWATKGGRRWKSRRTAGR